MCLHKKYYLPKISWKPITVYKVFLADLNGQLFTPFKMHKVKGNTIRAKYLSLFECTVEDTIGGSGVHAYISKFKALEKTSGWEYVCAKNKLTPCVHECVIPHFTFYWEGHDNDIAARKLRIKGRIPSSD